MPASAALRRELARLGAPRREVDLESLQPMLAETAAEPFAAPGWLFELKHDGFRALARTGRSRVQLVSSSGRSMAEPFP